MDTPSLNTKELEVEKHITQALDIFSGIGSVFTDESRDFSYHIRALRNLLYARAVERARQEAVKRDVP